jgi:putative hydrolase of the HAD superfamily
VLEAVIFDLDDTLFDHRGAAATAVTGWLTALGVQPSAKLEELWFAAENRHVAAWNRGEVSFEEQRRRRLRELLAVIEVGSIGRDGGDAELDALFADWAALYRGSWRSFDDSLHGLETVRNAGLKVAVLTNGAEIQQHQKLATVGLTGQVGPMFCCDALGFAKPDPRSYRAVADALGVPYERVLHVGDRHDLDVVGARAAGLNAVHLDRRGDGPHDESARITSLLELGGHLAAAAST